MENEITRSNCRKCSRITRMEVLFETKHDAGVSYFNELHTWQVLRCLGCETVGFRYRVDEYDNVTEDLRGKKQHAVRHFRYPNAIPGHRPLDHIHAVPDVIRQIYNQTISAYAGDAAILAGIGLRATIEAVCNHLKVSGAALEKRIDNLHKQGFISSSDKRRLHAIRFLGNDAAHEIKQPKGTELRVALDIIEHLINSVFILEVRAKNLDVQVETLDQFLELIRDCAERSKVAQAQSLVALVGKNRRRIGTDLNVLEPQLVAAIQDGTVDYLQLDAIEDVEGKPVQLYTVDRKVLDDDIPF